ncbi:MAG: hypothetical protein H7Y12_12785 [Sphingobacteriaceae bacterium]|nr:hypothetical protein [Cytophagaceae bacterium]
MEKFMLIFWNQATTEESFMEVSPEAMQAEMAKWNAWIGGIAAQGKLISSEGLLPSGKTISGKAQIVTDGPFSEAKEVVGGYTILTAANLDEAVQLANGCPMFEADGRVEVRPVMVFD